MTYRSATIALAATTILTAIVAGCSMAAPASYILFGPGKVEAEYTLAPVRTVVFVDDRTNVLPRTSLRATIGEKISQDLLSQGLVPNVVAPRDAIALTRSKEDGTKPLSIAAIGRELECQQVIYVQVTTFTLQGDGSFTTTETASGVGVTPTAKAMVKVIDVVNNQRTYPVADGPGRDIAAVMREIDPEKLRTVSQRRTVEDALATELGDEIGKLFYQHERIDQGEHLGPRNK